MNRTDRILALLTRDLSVDEMLDMGMTPADACDAVSLLNLELELSRRAKVGGADS